ncbi:class I adenylate-forming enzyme family protein [Amycolatopsis pithecellobii]|uniref:AMP-binding protein n=1 Tax=Amycolatopsis pithecellobii TaxID=664692 RepID=A0A6N7Z6R4_9PSEU|nr:AMP-binding protein [Amycolatopsis pithecellobii]MTD56530.1 AMP-binding protein [Amycolatopsis pithecellobii]
MRVIEYFDKCVLRSPSADLVAGHDVRYTYAEGKAFSERFAAALHADGMGPGDGVGLLAPNHPLVFLAMLGLWRAGGVWTPLTTTKKAAAHVDLVGHVGTRWIFYHSSMTATVEQIRRVSPVRRFVCFDRENAGDLSLEQFLALGHDEPAPDLGDPFGAPNAVAAIVGTGGTTGRSKAVVLTNQVFATAFEAGAQCFPQRGKLVNLAVAPLTHGAGMTAAMLSALGATIVVHERFDAGETLAAIEREHVTHMFLPPTAYYAMLDHPDLDRRDLSSLQMLLVSAAPVAPEKLREGVKRIGPCLASCWGQTEAPNLLTWLAPEVIAEAAAGVHPERLGSCGVATMQSHVAVMADDGRLLGTGERGELVARGRLVSPGYFDNTVATTEAHEHQWHHTGDIGYVDDDGYFYIVDRKKDVIISGGFNVYSAEVEAAILSRPDVLECAVVGLRDDYWGERVTAVVVMRAGEAADSDGIIQMCKSLLGSVQAPKQVVVRDHLPRTALGKIDKRALREELNV